MPNLQPNLERGQMQIKQRTGLSVALSTGEIQLDRAPVHQPSPSGQGIKTVRRVQTPFKTSEDARKARVRNEESPVGGLLRRNGVNTRWTSHLDWLEHECIFEKRNLNMYNWTFFQMPITWKMPTKFVIHDKLEQLNRSIVLNTVPGSKIKRISYCIVTVIFLFFGRYVSKSLQMA